MEDGPRLQTNLPFKKRRPTCARCRNHGMILDLKGHKKHCEYRTCECNRCKVVAQRRQMMARQVALSRQQEKEEQREQERRKILENLEHLPESQRFYQLDVSHADTTDSVDMTEKETVTDEPSLPLSINKPIPSSNLSKVTGTENYCPLNPGIVEQSMPQDLPSPHYHNELRQTQLDDVNASQVTGQRSYVTMKDYACQQFETSVGHVGASYWPGVFTQPFPALPPSHFNDTLAFPISHVVSYQTCQSAGSPLQSLSIPPSMPNPACAAGFGLTVPEQADSPPLEVTPSRAMTPSTSASTMLPSSFHNRVGRPISRPNRPPMITLPTLDKSRESTFSKPLSIVSSYPISYDPIVSSFSISGNTYTSSQINPLYDHEPPYSNYPSPTLPTQSTPVFSFPPPTSPSEAVRNFQLSYFDQVGTGALPVDNAPKQAVLYQTSIQENRQDSRDKELVECGIDVCSVDNY